MDCPKCRSALTERRIKGGAVKVDLCPSCKGMWFDQGEIEALMGVASKGLGVPFDAETGDRRCPACRDRLFEFKYPQTLVAVDACMKCKGIWLDLGEFTEIEAVRSAWKKSGKLEEHAPPTGVKGAMLRFVDAALGALKPW